MLATFATLILLVQHISTMLQAPNIAAAAGAELLDGDPRGEISEAPGAAVSRVKPFRTRWVPLEASGDSYGVRVVA